MTLVYFLLTPFPWKHTGFKVNTECQLWFPGNNVYYKGGPWLWTISDWKDCEWTCRPWRLMWSWMKRKLVSLWGVSYNIIYSWWGLTSCSDNWLQVVARVEYKKIPMAGWATPTHMVLSNWRCWDVSPEYSRKMHWMLSCKDAAVSCPLSFCRVKWTWCQVTAYWILWVSWSGGAQDCFWWPSVWSGCIPRPQGMSLFKFNR